MKLYTHINKKNIYEYAYQFIKYKSKMYTFLIYMLRTEREFGQ
jgi:hypothetical protein